MIDRLDYEGQPWFVFKNLHSINDMDCYTDYLPEIAPVKIYASKKVRGRSGRLNITYEDYDSYEYTIDIQLAEYDRLEAVKKWLTGSGKLIISTDPNKYRNVIVTNASKPIEFENEAGFFWKFKITFLSEPFKKNLNERFIPLNISGSTKIHNNGDETAKPIIKLVSEGGDVAIKWEAGLFKLLDTPEGIIEVNSETGLVISDGKRIKNKGDRPLLLKGFNTISLSGKVKKAEIYRGCVFL
ncbi:phage tail protein [Enterococcus sp. DIV1420a]|uniref:phage tail protein n=1 Tax=Enterococcus TaxID=1350 RepID=UPI003F283ABE